MKSFLLPIVASLLLLSSSFAQVATEEPKPPTPAQPAAAPTPKRTRTADTDFQRGQAAQAVAEQDLAYTKTAFANWKQKLEKASYLGIATSPMPTVLRDQLKLDKGVGLVVDRVDTDSPAEAAGIKPSDVIQKLDDQILINPNQFGVLVRTLKPDVEIKLAIIREAKPQTISVKPVEKDLAPLDQPIIGYGGNGGYQNAMSAYQNRFTPNAGRLTVTAGPAGNFATEIATINNDNMTITTTTGPKGEKHVTAIDKPTGKVIYDNLINDGQLKDLPPEVAEQIAAMDKVTLAKPVRVMKGNFNGAGINFVRAANNLPKVKAVSGSDDDFTWDLTTKTDENGKPELDLLLLDKNGKKVFDGPFSRSRDLPNLPQPMSDRLSSYPWDLIIEDLKGGGGGGGGVQFNLGGGNNKGVDLAPVPAKPGVR
jgi:membrane-associated protease RseP (regulator of RpoE activity)